MAASWRLKIGGEGAEKPLELSLEQLSKEFEQVELAAVCQCSGNRRGLSDPHVTGVEWGYGAMGNAQWKGVRLKDVLARAGVKKETIEIGFNGADKGVVDATPDFIKSIPAWKAMDENTLVATHMNGEPLPHWNGYPARIVVPGWTATYWVKMVTEINALTKPQGGFWMAAAYRIPLGKFPLVDRFITQETDKNTPITEMVVNSLITNLLDGDQLPAGKPAEVRGIAWDGGYGIAEVNVSVDGGKTWQIRHSWRGSRALRMAAVVLPLYAVRQGRIPDHGARHQCAGHVTGVEAHLQSTWLSQQRRPDDHSAGRVREANMRKSFFLPPS